MIRKNLIKLFGFLLPIFFPSILVANVIPGVDVFFQNNQYKKIIEGKKIALITHYAAKDLKGEASVERFCQKENPWEILVIGVLENGLFGNKRTGQEGRIKVNTLHNIPVIDLIHNKGLLNEEFHNKIEAIVCDVQDIGSRSYTFLAFILKNMELAAKLKIPFILCDRPNPMGGLVFDGPGVSDKWRSSCGYIDVPLCHGMTLGELALLFRGEYCKQCLLTVVPMKGWKRSMLFKDTGLLWTPTSPQINEWDTAFGYATTGMIGHLSLCSIGIGYTLPFKVIGAPWINADKLVELLNKQGLPGVFFSKFVYTPFFGKYKGETCEGAFIHILDPKSFLPIETQYTIIGVIKNLYPENFDEAIRTLIQDKVRLEVFNQINGDETVIRILKQQPFVIWPLRSLCKEQRQKFSALRSVYLLPSYCE